MRSSGLVHPSSPLTQPGGAGTGWRSLDHSLPGSSHGYAEAKPGRYPPYVMVDGSMQSVCIDPPYYDNVMYAELADFFYVWEKRTLGWICGLHLFR